MPKVVVAVALSIAVVLSSASLALAANFDIRGKWKNCETNKAGLTFRTEFINPARWHGPGRYLIKSQIRWDKYSSGMFRRLDSNTIQTEWTKITNEEFDFGLSHGDRTNWGAWYPNYWRAHVIVKLIKNWPGPKDKQVEKEERFFQKGLFDERGSCGVNPET